MPTHYIQQIHNFLHTPVVDYQYISSGWDYDVIITAGYIFRFAKNQKKTLNSYEEQRQLNIIRPYVSIPIPHYTYVDESMMVCPVIPGKIMEKFTAQTLPQVIQFLQQLHNIPIDQIAPTDSTHTDTHDEGLHTFVDQLKQKIEIRLVHKGIVKHVITAIHDYMDELFFRFQSSQTAFVHTDLQPKNIIVSQDNKHINGILDFTDSRIGSIELDFCHILTHAPELIHHAIELYRGSYDPSLYDRIFFLSRRTIVFSIDNDTIYQNDRETIQKELRDYKFLSS